MILRAVVLGLGILLLTAGVVGLTLNGGPAMLAPLTFGVLLLLGTVFEPHYKRNQPNPPNDGFTPTGERFQDPTQGNTVEVWYNKATGERRYVSLPGKAEP
jgi:hypothetical protein